MVTSTEINILSIVKPYLQVLILAAAFPNQFNPHPYMLSGPPSAFLDPYQHGMRSNYNLQGSQMQQPLQPPTYPPPNYPPPNHPSSFAPPQQQTNSGPMASLQPIHNTAEREVPHAESPDTLLNYPTGSLHREVISGEGFSGWNFTKWVWRSIGKSSRNGRLVKTRSCVGALICRECERVTRPLTQVDSWKRQIASGCTFPTCPSNGPLEHQTCNARSYHFKENTTPHERPPGGSLSQSEQAQLDDQVRRRQTATVHQLRTGDTGLGSVPLADISATLANPRSARYHVSQSQARIGIPPTTSSKGGLAFFKSLAAFRTKLSTSFIVDSSLNGPCYISFQTPFMDSLIKEAIEVWIADFAEGPEAGRHGFVTDGDMSFFRHGPLLAHVMDFSGAQRAAHAEEYADAIISTMQPAFSQLAQAAQDVQRKVLVEEAKTTQVGCDLHFSRSANTTPGEIAETVNMLKATFPRIVGWINWWLRPPIASMIFPALSVVNPELADKVPSTTNPIEHQHSLLHHATGTDMDLVQGAENIWLHVRELEKQYDAIKGMIPILRVIAPLKHGVGTSAGHFNAVPPRTYRPPRPQQWEPNDGRAPDTVAALDLLTPGTRQGTSRL
ncbi:hypothetical protein B0H14DRAFT_2633085 [Mycena olivaceomarginata]|nr:hypothetical protein B0H14DRAFT_2633085 [Mycena olivaceomarginata]